MEISQPKTGAATRSCSKLKCNFAVTVLQRFLTVITNPAQLHCVAKNDINSSISLDQSDLAHASKYTHYCLTGQIAICETQQKSKEQEQRKKY